MTGAHTPVMLNEVLASIAPRDGGVYVDGTFGVGGYTTAFLEAADCTVYAIDRDPDAVARGRALADHYRGRLLMIEGRFGDMDLLLESRGTSRVDGVALDVGVSSPQLDDPRRGFSFRADGPLDMRMDRTGPSAADVVNTYSEPELADIIYRYGEERASRRIARAIVAERNTATIETTGRLAEIIRGAVRPSKDGIDPATRTFQGLRIYINDEMGELERGLTAAETILGPGGRLAVVSFHSLEDRIVKTFFKKRSGSTAKGSRHLPDTPGDTPRPTFRLLTRKPLRPRDEEVDANPRARSARLRAAERTDALPDREAA